MKQSEVNEILHLHQLWLKNDPEGKRADLREANLLDANLRNADLQNAELSYAGLRNTDLWNANLRNAGLRNTDLHGLLINKDNPSVFYQSENITILDTEIGMFYVFSEFTTSCIPKHLIKREVNNFKELITVLSMNS